ncbi:type III pantothenate kinase, partial [Ruminococcus flavefaciens]|uniref:type III pantothenate kinase n=1 Tax=Ruminococcus flavefaciens TaxID=1265 RepID=UPI00325B98F3
MDKLCGCRTFRRQRTAAAALPHRQIITQIFFRRKIMLLAVDIGNTNIVFGCVDEKDEVVLFERISTDHNATAAEYAVL